MVRSFLSPSLLGVFLLIFQVGASPSQYYAQIYTEILGRSPEPSEWVANEYRFDEGSLTVSGARSIVTSFFQSAEFRNLGYTPSEQAYVLYRSVLLREPGTAEMQNIANQIASGVSASSVATSMMGSTEYSNLIQQRIGLSRSHGFLDSGPAERPSISGTGVGNVAGGILQDQLNAAAPGSTVFLQRGALVRLYEQLVVPSGVTLATYDSGEADHIFKSRQAYAAMGRLIRSQMFNKPLVKLEPGAKVIGVWIDGRRSQLRLNDPTLKNPTLSSSERFQFSHNISILGGTSGSQVSEVSHCKISDSTGWTALHGVGNDGALGIGFSRIGNNMITSYSASRDLEESFFTDGISNASSDAIIVNNDIVDSSDVGIVLFNPGMVTGQRSQVAGNSILFAGIDGWGGITMDHSVKILDFCLGVNPNGFYNCFDVSNEAIASSFEGVLIQDNQIWSSDTHHTNVGISLGVQLWGLRMFGKGGQVLQNDLGTAQQPLNTGVGIAVAGIKQPVVLDNTLNLSLDQNLISCHSTPLLVDPTKTTLTPPDALLQSGFVTGETWGLLRPKTNGYVFGNFNLLPSNETNRGVTLNEPAATLQVQDLSSNTATDEWVIVHSERSFGDENIYYLIKNKGTSQVVETFDGSVHVAPYSGEESQYWRLEAFDGAALGNGLRLLNRVTGESLGRDANGNIFVSTDFSNSSMNWKFSKIETRELELNQSDLMFVDLYGEIFQTYTEAGLISEDRSLGNPNSELNVKLFADDFLSHAKPLGIRDYNNDGRSDLFLLLSDRSLYVAYQGADGFKNGANLGNMYGAWTWDITREHESWEKPLGFVDVDGNGYDDLVVVDNRGFLEVGYINASGLGATADLPSAGSLGLLGLKSATSSVYKSVGAGDFDGDGDNELLFVGAAGGLFRVDVSGGTLQAAVGLGNPVESFGFGFTSNSESVIKPVAITDVNGDGVDDVVMVEPTGYLLAYIMRDGTFSGAANVGSPQRSWGWKLNAYSRYSRPLGIAYGKGWWGW